MALAIVYERKILSMWKNPAECLPENEKRVLCAFAQIDGYSFCLLKRRDKNWLDNMYNPYRIPDFWMAIPAVPVNDLVTKALSKDWATSRGSEYVTL